ncbi:MAG: undecaprenyl-diphosphate phosphatase [Candidatus Izemoplasmatales bacterium]
MDLLEALKYIILGLIQGITEVLPISSSGHVEIVKALVSLQQDEGLLFLILVNTGSFVTLFLIYFKKLWHIAIDFILYIFKKTDKEIHLDGFKFFIKLIIASIPAGVIGILFNDQLDQLTKQYSTLLAGVGLLITGTVLVLAATRRVKRGKTQINYADAIIVGLAQGIALLPGVSRSGMTASTSIYRGMGVTTALDFSFLLYIPASLGSILVMFLKSGSEGFGIEDNIHLVYYGLAFITAMIATYFAYKLIFNIFRTGKVRYFGFYCLVAGFFSIGLYIF